MVAFLITMVGSMGIFSVGITLASLATTTVVAIGIMLVFSAIGALVFSTGLGYSCDRDWITNENKREYERLAEKGHDTVKGNYKNPSFFKWLARSVTGRYEGYRHQLHVNATIRKNYKD